MGKAFFQLEDLRVDRLAEEVASRLTLQEMRQVPERATRPLLLIHAMMSAENRAPMVPVFA